MKLLSFLCLWASWVWFVPCVLAEPPTEESLRRGARLGDLQLVQQAIEANIPVNCQTEYGVTPLSLACDHGHEAIAKYLLEHGADPNIKDKFYRVGPMGWALSRKRGSVIKLLVDGGCKEVDAALIGVLSGGYEEPLRTEIVESVLKSEHVTTSGLKAAWTAAMSAKLESIVALIETKLPESDRPAAPTAASPPSNLSAMQSVVGSYKNESGTKLIFAIKDNQLTVRTEESEQSFPLTFEEKDHFKTPGMDVFFVREKDKVVSMKMKVGDREVLYSRLADAPATPADKPNVDAAKKERTESSEGTRPDYSLDSPHWPGFRGTLARGIAEKASIPIEWDGQSGKNIAWKVPIDGLATSSPIVWGNRVFLTTAIRESDQRGFRVGAYGDVESENFSGECEFRVLCLDLGTGKVIWEEEATRAIPKVKRHAKSSHANPTPVTDGERVIASFGGEGIYAYSMEGELLWTLQLGVLDSGWFYDPTYQWGFGSSPFLFEDMVILQCDVQEGSFLVAVDAATGKERWRTARNEIPTWSTPVAFMDPSGQPRIVVAGTKKSAGYDARTGDELWSLGGFSEIMVPTPQITPYGILLASGYAPVQPIVVLDHGAEGELKMPEEKKGNEDKKGTAPFQWSTLRGGPYMPTPIIYRDHLFVLDNSGILSCFNMRDGTRLYRKRIRSEEANAFTASPIIANGNLYAISEIGISFVVRLDSEGEVIATNNLGESVLASPAIGGNKLLIRGEKHLFAIETAP